MNRINKVKEKIKMIDQQRPEGVSKIEYRR